MARSTLARRATDGSFVAADVLIMSPDEIVGLGQVDPELQ